MSRSSAMSNTPIYRSFTTADIPGAHALSIAVHWPHRAEDWQFAFDAGTGFVAEDSGNLIGTALCWTFGDDRGTLGLVIVSPDEQGRGIGRHLLDLVIKELGERVTFLYATPAGQPLYEKLGFRACGTLNQHQGIIARVPSVPPLAGECLRKLESADRRKVIELASRSSGFDRSATLHALFEFSEGVVLEGEHGLLGFSLFRRFGRGYVVGPVVADHSQENMRAKALITYWLARNEGKFIRIDLPGWADVSEWLNQIGMLRGETVVKMVRNASPEQHNGEPDTTYRAFGIINQAMG